MKCVLNWYVLKCSDVWYYMYLIYLPQWFVCSVQSTNHIRISNINPHSS